MAEAPLALLRAAVLLGSQLSPLFGFQFRAFYCDKEG